MAQAMDYLSDYSRRHFQKLCNLGFWVECSTYISGTLLVDYGIPVFNALVDFQLIDVSLSERAVIKSPSITVICLFPLSALSVV